MAHSLAWRIMRYEGLSPEDRDYFVVEGRDSEVVESELTLLGNPVKDVLNFQFNASEIGLWNLELHDELGKLHLAETIELSTSRNIQSLEVRALPLGMYILSLKKGDQKVQSRLIISE